ncbi:spindle and centriole-associated protein 1-like isoform X2 [Hydractinia symbiolongicarpus]|uniref:spindle and centriole-associated protein 1-like isoform X2 n=1 Tax=Hydractinia symbiolongicarpus TaxID=13093 RepID=UPI00254B6447|nr:spindle and centriole-associated protein 1-like isoform X2 [Hydractinia symbiolongicarpus]
MSTWQTNFRKPVRSRSQLLVSSQINKKKKTKTKPKPEWDSTAKDLTIFKPSPQELKRNHELHQPKKDHERLIRKIDCAKQNLNNSDLNFFDATPGVAQRKRALIKEVFRNNEKKLKNVLAETDRALADVKDMFGDDAVQKYQGKPNIVRAPCHKEHSFLHQLVPHQPSFYDVLSESVMITPALNSLSDEDEESDHDSNQDEMAQVKYHQYGREKDTNPSYQSRLDINRYQDLVTNSAVSNSHLSDVQVDLNSLSHFCDDLQSDNAEEKQPPEINKMISSRDKVLLARNGEDVAKNSDSGQVNSINALQSFADMKTMLDLLEEEISQYERENGKENVVKNYQSERQLRAEMAMRQTILDAFEEQRALTDALTADLLETQEANETLKREVDLQKKANQTRFASLETDVKKLEQKIHESLCTNSIRYDANTLNANLKPLLDISNLDRTRHKYHKVSPSISPISFSNAHQ